jgi:hypothetical protein
MNVIFFTDRSGSRVWRLPADMDTEEAEPTLVE